MNSPPEHSDGSPEQAPAEADRLARRLLDDVTAFEVDPPAPARVTTEQDQRGE